MLTTLLLMATQPALADGPAPKTEEAAYDEHSPELGLAMRPLTNPANPDLSEGKIENFFTLYIDPDAAAATLKPKTPGRNNTTETLPIVNITMAWQEITVDGTKIGVMGPLTTGAIHGVRAGEYVVKMTSSTGYTETARVQTTNDMAEIIVPGNASASVAFEEGYRKPGFDRAEPETVDTIVGYTLPTPPAPEPEEASE